MFRVSRRAALVAGAAGLVGLAAGRPIGAAAADAPDGLVDQGVGMYTDPSVANQISSFSINPTIVTCGVGTLAYGSSSGPFAMLMYSLHHDEYGIDRATGVISVTGRMRSITRVAGNTVEDAQHHFLAIAHAKGPDGPRFDVHMVTPFWNPSNPMSTHSTVVDGAVRFGGKVLLGEIAVGS
jgi:hypothetical protein